MLGDAQISQFIHEGFVKIPEAFPRELADHSRSILWRDTGCDEADPRTWTKPVIRLGMYAQKPFAAAANTAVLHQAFDQLVGRGRWRSRSDLGTFPIRFPSPDDPGDAGWHVDSSFPPDSSDTGDFLNWRINVVSRGRALLMLFLFSDIGENDAPTHIRVGSHLDVARILAPLGESGLSSRELAGQEGFAKTASRHERAATEARSTCAIRFWCMPHKSITASIRGFLRSRRFSRPNRFFSSAWMAHTLRSSKPSESHLIFLEGRLTPLVFALPAKKRTPAIALGAEEVL